MKLYAATEQACQALADKAHAYKIERSAAYAQSVQDGKTLRWSLPLRETDANGDPVGDWYIPFEADLLGAFTEAELQGLDQDGKDWLASLGDGL